jgi:hypothetical protein
VQAGSRAPFRRFTLVATALGAVAALGLTFPLPLQLGSAVLEDGSYDAYQFTWNVWWVGESLLRLGTNPFHTTYLFHPDGVPLLFHTFSFSLGLVTLPLQVLFPDGALTAHNLLVVAAPALAVVAASHLAREVVDDPWAALAGGLVLAVNPVAVWFLPVIYLSCSYLVAGLAWAWWRMQRRRRGADVALALGLLATLVFASQEYALMALALLALDTVLRVSAPRLCGLRPVWAAGTLGFWALVVVGLVPLALVAAAAPAAAPPPWHVRLGSGYVAGLLTPPWLAPPPKQFWTILYLGTVPLALLVPAFLSRHRAVVFWLLAALALGLMTLGPHLHLRNPYLDPRPPFDALPVTGPPGPYALALELVPLMRFFRAPYRWVVALQVALAVLAAIGVAALRARIRARGARALATALLLVLVVAGGLLDARGLRAPVLDAPVPAVYAILRDDPEPAAVLELPSGLVAGRLAAFSSLYMYYQTVHRKFLLEGTVSRLPPGRRIVLEREITDLAALPWVKYVVLHRDLLDHAHPASRRQAGEVAALLATQGQLVARDGGTELYRTLTFRGAGAQETP